MAQSAHEMVYFIQNVRVGIAIAVLQMQMSLEKKGRIFSINELCEILKDKKVNWKSRCVELEKQVQCLEAQISSSKDIRFWEQNNSQDEIFLPSFAENKFADIFLSLKTLNFNESLTISQENLDEVISTGLKYLETALENTYWPDSLLETCGQILRKSFTLIDENDFEVTFVEEQLKQFVSKMLRDISDTKESNKNVRFSRLGIAMQSIIPESNLKLMETTLLHLFQQAEDKLKSFISNRDNSDYEIIYNFLEIAESIMEQTSKTSSVESPLIKLFNKIHKIYEMSLDWPLINYRMWQFMELIKKM